MSIVKTAVPVLFELVVHALVIGCFIAALGLWAGIVSGGI